MNTNELIKKLRQMSAQILTQNSRSKQFFNECADRMEALEQQVSIFEQAFKESKQILDQTPLSKNNTQ